MSENISAAIALNGEMVMKQPLIKSMRVVKKETLKLIADWIDRCSDHQMVLHLLFYFNLFFKSKSKIHLLIIIDYFSIQVLDNFIPPLLDAVLLDYQKTNIPYAREPEVLSTMATIVNKLEGHITSEVPKIFEAVFKCTLDMINKDFEEFPEHRTNFFLLLQVTYKKLSI
jgi:exportin-1